METLIEVFEPDTFFANMITVVCAIISVGIIAFLFIYQKKELSYAAKKRRGMISILLGIVLLLTSATAILNYWNSLNFKPIKLYSDHIEMPNGEVKFKDIQQAYIFVDKPMTIVTPPPDSLMNYDRLLIIEEFDKTSHVLSEDNYPIEKILDKMREIRK